MSRVQGLAIIAATLGGVVALHEWFYRHDHPHRSGPSVWIALLGVAVAMTAGCVAWLIGELARQRS